MKLSKMAITALAAVYILWGSTYLGILYAIETIPPWTMSSLRYLIAGAAMLLLANFRREEKLTPTEVRFTWYSGPPLVLANGVVCVVEKWVPSGVAAVLIGAMPIWIMLIGWIAFGEAKPTSRKLLGAFIGLAGVAVIAASNVGSETSQDSALGGLYLVLCSWLWAAGTLTQRKAPPVRSIFRFSAEQMLRGALAVGIVSFIFESPWSIAWSEVSLRSWLALFYLVIFGSIIAFTAYSWLSRNVEPHLVSTYALVNPIIAVALGTLFNGEALTPRFLGAAILVGVGLGFLITNRKPKLVESAP